MHIRPAALAALALLAPADNRLRADEKPDVIARSVVKVLATQSGPDIYHPWANLPQTEAVGSGVVIEGRRILTNAEVVKHASRVLVEPDRSGEKLNATVEFLAEDVDMAILKLEDPAFFDAHPPLPRAQGLPKIKETVIACGFPLGGENLATTRGIVSRIEFEQYYFATMGLRIQVDAAINSGNSGGPALIDDKMIGIIFNRLQQTDNIGYIIPNEEIDLFLADVADGTYDGKPTIADIFTSAQNKTLRADLGLPKELNGMVCRKPAKADEAYPLKARDVLIAIGGHALDAAARADVDGDLRLDARYLVQKLAKGGKVPVTLFRDGKTLEIELPVVAGPARHYVLPYLMGRKPSYFIWGPLAFTAATDDYLIGLEREQTAQLWLPFLSNNRSPMISRRGDTPRFEGEQLVVVVALFPHRMTQGYGNPDSLTVDTVDGTKVKNLRHLGELLRDGKSPRATISFNERNSEFLIFDRAEVKAATEEILNDNGIRKPFSDDLKDLFAPAG